MRIAMVGNGKIVHSCLDAINRIDDISCDAVCVRPGSIEKGEQLCAQYGITKLYSDYGQLLRDNEIDFIYIGLPNHLHFEYVQAALQANKHVICEKPFTINAAELEQLTVLAQQKQLFLFEAITNIYTPNTAEIQKALPDIGPVKLVQSNYSQLSSRYAHYLAGDVHPAFDPKMAGGALYDINIYNIHLCCYLFGVPLTVSYTCNKGFNGVDTSGVMQLQYDGFIAQCCGAKDSDSPGQMVIQGEKGYIRLLGATNAVASVAVTIAGNTRIINHQDEGNHMVYELRRFASMYQQQALAECYRYLQHSVEVMHVLEKGRQQVIDPNML